MPLGGARLPHNFTGPALAPYYNPECECFIVLLLNTRRRVKGHQLVSIGTMDTILIHAREVFRAAIVANASALILAHNHPSGVIPHPVLCRKGVEITFETSLFKHRGYGIKR